METGLPLIPAMTPVVASGPPSSRARIRLRLGPMAFSSTPRMWALNSSTVVPANTVRPMPTMPGLTSLTGITGEAADSGHNARHASRMEHDRASEQHLGHNPSAGPTCRTTR